MSVLHQPLALEVEWLPGVFRPLRHAVAVHADSMQIRNQSLTFALCRSLTASEAGGASGGEHCPECLRLAGYA
ncbi:hypothetical protein GCM10010174_60860 [Kutzneria viridogrisea]|uniref:Uncharacterized protein n=2 Tax=Kutzneria TaxID=43356 RepID=W5WBG8_9PSEU|nr:hypothetical protein [Kutzneria albida]AHH95569.1 hypothetical protein KALB_2200 [Kutzneria albida DSM 43870]MBA8927069.1 hypothetical protein [Kutzneria viridogrisea]